MIGKITLFTLLLVGAASAECGTASVYWVREQGSRTASGVPLRDSALTAAHRMRRFGSHVTVTYNGRSVGVTITDRGPFVRGRIIDLSLAAANALRLKGLGKVCLS